MEAHLEPTAIAMAILQCDIAMDMKLASRLMLER
jgi:hypothetical protein